MESLLFPENGAGDNDIFRFLNLEDPISITDDYHEESSSAPHAQDDPFLPPLPLDLEPWSHIQPAIDIDMPFFPETNHNHNHNHNHNINGNSLHNHVPSSPEEHHILSPASLSPSSSSSPTSSPTSYPPGIAIKSEPASPSRN